MLCFDHNMTKLSDCSGYYINFCFGLMPGILVEIDRFGHYKILKFPISHDRFFFL